MIRAYVCARARRARQVHTEEHALIIYTLQIYNTTIHTSVGAETQEGRALLCQPACQPMRLFVKPSSRPLSFLLVYRVTREEKARYIAR